MKKVSLELRAGAEGRSVCLFPSSEALYSWWMSVEGEDPMHLEGVDVVELEQGQFMEAEWLGCEYSYDAEPPQRMNFIRLAKAHESKNASGMLMTMHYGWVEETWIPFKDVSEGDVIVKVLIEGECRLEMPELLPDETDVDVSGVK